VRHLHLEFALANSLSLDLYFGQSRLVSGPETFTESHLRQSLPLPLHQQPHSCLLFAMYTMAAGDSDIPAIRRLAEGLYMLASASLNESIAEQDGLLDAVTAGRCWQDGSLTGAGTSRAT
jgi:hypothetical protein